MKCWNNEKKEELEWKSPFEMFYEKKSSELLNDGKSSEDFDSDIVSTKLHSQTEYLQQAKQTEDRRNSAEKADEQIAKLMVEKHARKNIYKAYNPDEKVFVRIGKKRKFAKSHEILAGTVEKRYQDDSYLVKYKLVNPYDSTKAKFRIKDISDFTIGKNVNAKENKKNKERKAYQKSLCIPKVRNDLIGEIKNQGYIVIYDSPGDGNCQFSTLCESLLNFGIFRSSQTLREEIVNYLIRVESINDKVVRDFSNIPWDDYIQQMNIEGTYGDNLTLRPFANIFNIEIKIVLTLGNDGRVSVNPENSNPLGRITLRH